MIISTPVWHCLRITAQGVTNKTFYSGTWLNLRTTKTWSKIWQRRKVACLFTLLIRISTTEITTLSRRWTQEEVVTLWRSKRQTLSLNHTLQLSSNCIHWFLKMTINTCITEASKRNAMANYRKKPRTLLLVRVWLRKHLLCRRSLWQKEGPRCRCSYLNCSSLQARINQVWPRRLTERAEAAELSVLLHNWTSLKTLRGKLLQRLSEKSFENKSGRKVALSTTSIHGMMRSLMPVIYQATRKASSRTLLSSIDSSAQNLKAQVCSQFTKKEHTIIKRSQSHACAVSSFSSAIKATLEISTSKEASTRPL